MLIQGMPAQNVYAEGMGDPNDVETPEDIEQDEADLTEEQEQYSIQLSNAGITDSSGNVIDTRDFICYFQERAAYVWTQIIGQNWLKSVFLSGLIKILMKSCMIM